MKRFLVVLALVLLLPVVGDGQSINNYPAAGAAGMVASDVVGSLSTTTSGTSEEVLRTWTIPANSFPTANVGFFIRATWKTAANANSKTPRIRVGGIGGKVCVGGAVATSNDRILHECVCMVDASNNFTCAGQQARLAAGGAYNMIDTTSGTYTFSSAIDIVATGTTGTQAGDVTLTSFSAYFFRP